MKKHFILLLLLLLLTAFMTFDSFAESALIAAVDEKASPAVSQDDPGWIEGEGMDAVRIAYDEISIWSYAERQTAPESVRNSLGYAYSVIRGVASLGELNAQLDAEVQTFNTSFSAAAFVVSDLFCLSLTEEKTALLQIGENRTLQITLQYVSEESRRAPVVIFQDPVNKTWSLAECRFADEPDTISIRLSEPGTIAILAVDGTRMDSRDMTGTDRYIWISVLVVMAAIFAAVTLFIVFYRRGRPASHGTGTDAFGTSRPGGESLGEKPIDGTLR